MSTTTSIVAALIAALETDDVPVLDGVYPLPNGLASSTTSDDSDLADWCILYGLAFAMLRERDPWAHSRDLAGHARTAVWDALTATDRMPESVEEVAS